MAYSITLEDLKFLQSSKGQENLKELLQADLTPPGLFKIIENLRKSLNQAETSALIETAVLRIKAKKKFKKAHLMYFLEDALEQATGEVISAHRAKRYKNYKKVIDLTCGIGGDLAGIADAAGRAVGADIDEVRLEIAKANMKALGFFEKTEFYCGDLRRKWDGDGFFADPGRREKGKRIFRLDRLKPPLNEILELRKYIPSMGIKIMPGVDYNEIPKDCEVEFISHEGICKEAVLWFGDLRKSVGRRATILPESIEIEEKETEPVKVGEPLSYIYEPDSAIIRAHFVEWLAGELKCHKLDKEIAYLTGDKLIKTPLARLWKIEEVLPFSLKKINKKLKELNVGEAVIKKRGTAVEPDHIRKKLKMTPGGRKAVIFLTRLMEKQSVLICSEV